MKRTFWPLGLLITLCILSITLFCSCSSEKSTTYSSEQLHEALEDAIYKGKTQFTVLYDTASLSQEDARVQLEHCLSQDYLAGCLLEDAELTFEDNGSGTESTFLLTYNEATDFEGMIHDISDDSTMRKTLASMMKQNARKTALLLKNYSLSEEQIFNLLDEAEINCADAPCEATNVSYAIFDPYENMQLLIVWGEYPIEEDSIKEKKAELVKATAAYAEELAKNNESAQDTYEAIFDLICNKANYDQNIASLTLLNTDRLSDSMHIDRSAYGAIVSKNTVCTGYARGFKALCDALDLPCYVIMGSHDGVTHAWNAVQVDGQTYYVDCTSADTGTAKEKTFLFTPEQAQMEGYIEASSCHIPW